MVLFGYSNLTERHSNEIIYYLLIAFARPGMLSYTFWAENFQGDEIFDMKVFRSTRQHKFLKACLN